MLDRRLQVDVVRADPGGQRQLELGCLGDPLRGQVGGPEGLGDHHIGVRKLSLEDRVGSILVRGDDQLVAASLEELAQPELSGDAAEQLARLEVDPFGSRRGLAVVVALDLGNVVSRIAGRVPVHRIVVEHAEDLRHHVSPFPRGLPASIRGGASQLIIGSKAPAVNRLRPTRRRSVWRRPRGERPAAGHRSRTAPPSARARLACPSP